MTTLFLTTVLVGTAVAQETQPEANPTPVEPKEATEAVVDPEATRILDRAVEMMGGKQNRAAIQSSRSVASLITTQGGTEFELLTMNPNKFLVRQRIEGLGQLEMGFDGKLGWRRDPPDGMLTELDPTDMDRLRDQFDLQALIRNLDTRFSERTAGESVELEGRLCDTVELARGTTKLTAYFDQKTGLPFALVIPNESGRDRSRRVIIEKWSDDARPLRWAKRLRIEQGRGMTMEAVYSSVTFDDVSETTFDGPSAQLKALQQQEVGRE